MVYKPYFGDFVKKLIFILCVCILGLNAKMVEITDVVGNKVSIDAPAKKIALGLYYTEFMAVGGKFDNVVGFSKVTFSEWNANLWKMYLKVMPELDKVADFGEAEAGTFSVERILSLEPDVLVLAKWQYDGIKESLKPLEKVGIPVVVIDYHSGNYHSLSTKILGQITDNEQRANQIINEYESKLNYITQKTKNIKNKSTIYVEYGYTGAKENGITYSHYMWGDLIDKAGGANIADGLVKTHGAINPETVLVKNPDVIIIAGREAEVKKGETMLMGNDISFKDANDRLKTFTQRVGWSDLNAVKNGMVFGGYHGMLRNLSDIFMIEYIAKALYPDVFADLDPKKDYLEFNKKYLPVVPEGTFMIKLDDEKF